MLHLDVFKQRLEEEHAAEVIVTNPSVPYQILYRSGEVKIIENPNHFPSNDHYVAEYREPLIAATMMLPKDYLGAVLGLCEVILINNELTLTL